MRSARASRRRRWQSGLFLRILRLRLWWSIRVRPPFTTLTSASLPFHIHTPWCRLSTTHPVRCTIDPFEDANQCPRPASRADLVDPRTWAGTSPEALARPSMTTWPVGTSPPTTRIGCGSPFNDVARLGSVSELGFSSAMVGQLVRVGLVPTAGRDVRLVPGACYGRPNHSHRGERRVKSPMPHPTSPGPRSGSLASDPGRCLGKR